MSKSRMSTTENAHLSFKKNGETSQLFRPSSNKIGWLHSKANKPGARFDVRIKDLRGHIIVEKQNCGNDTDRYGELVNIPVMMGQEVTVEVENMNGAEEVDLFLN